MKGQDITYPTNEEEEMKKRIVIALVTGLMVASFSGCGEKTDIATKSPENSSVVESEIETENSDVDETINEEVAGEDTKEEELGDIEDENIIIFEEKQHYDYIALSEMSYEPYDGFVMDARAFFPLLNEEGDCVGQIKKGGTVAVTEISSDGWGRFKNPIQGTEYDYLYISEEFINSDELHLDAASMSQGIKDYINEYGLEEANYTFLSEKSSDMEVYEFRMDSEYKNQRMFDYWLGENLSNESFYTYCYETLYIECEDDTDGWIICRIYYKDPIELGY